MSRSIQDSIIVIRERRRVYPSIINYKEMKNNVTKKYKMMIIKVIASNY